MVSARFAFLQTWWSDSPRPLESTELRKKAHPMLQLIETNDRNKNDRTELISQKRPDTHSSMRWRIAVSTAIGFASGVFCWFLMVHFHQDAADFRWALRLARYMLQRQNPYNTPLEQYPLTAAFFALPFLRFTPEVAAGLFWGISSALLAFGLTREGYGRLRIFLAYPFWAGILTVQWSPILAASAFFPLLLPVTMAKPQIGLPVFLTHLSRRGLVACALLATASLAVMPSWPVLWLRQTANYEFFVPMLILPGPLLLLALFRYRDRDALLLVLTALMPQRWFFDAFILWLIPKSRREIVWTAFLSWGAGIWRWYHYHYTSTQVGRWVVIFLYLPMLVVVLLRPRAELRAETQPGPLTPQPSVLA